MRIDSAMFNLVLGFILEYKRKKYFIEVGLKLSFIQTTFSTLAKGGTISCNKPYFIPVFISLGPVKPHYFNGIN